MGRGPISAGGAAAPWLPAVHKLEIRAIQGQVLACPLTERRGDMRLKSKVTEEGVLLPKKLFRGIKEVEIRRKNNAIVVVPIEDDPIFQLGSRPVAEDIDDASVNHDTYICGK
jgi:virulence-associated protein VagC